MKFTITLALLAAAMSATETETVSEPLDDYLNIDFSTCGPNI